MPMPLHFMSSLESHAEKLMLPLLFLQAGIKIVIPNGVDEANEIYDSDEVGKKQRKLL